ncbi:hypothetical protein [Demequina sp.]|uniref:hypothetical protein n=1 Tax=Demequina sp. TaxID=2050685 RepID=UPI0025BD1770|nr:hypothetical protein [Demequina sp.]
MAKKKNSRKALAVALGIMGVAGLSVASASQLTVNVNDDNIAVGTGSFLAACDTAVDVDYTYNAAMTEYVNLTISDIDADCADAESLSYTINGTTAASTTYTESGTVTTPLGTSVVVDLTGVPLTTSLDSIDIQIFTP